MNASQATVSREQLNPATRQAILHDTTELEILLRAARQQRSSQNRISPENRELLQEFFKILNLNYSQEELSKFLKGRIPTFSGLIAEMPTLSNAVVLRLELFIKKYGIALDSDLTSLAKGEVDKISGNFQNSLSKEQLRDMGRDIRSLEKFGIYIGVLEDGRIYLGNRLGYLFQRLANNGIIAEPSPDGRLVISNNMYVPNIPASILRKLEKALDLAGTDAESGNFQDAININGIVQNIINIYKLTENSDSLAKLAHRFIGIKLTQKEWGDIKKEFNQEFGGEEFFRNVTGASYAEFEQLGLSLGELARWHAMEATTRISRVATTYENALDKFLAGASKEELASAAQECEQSRVDLNLADFNIARNNIVLGNLAQIFLLREGRAKFDAIKIPGEMERSEPDIAGTIKSAKMQGIRFVESAESHLKSLIFYSLAARGYSLRNDTKGFETVARKADAASSRVSGLLSQFSETEGQINRIIEDRLQRMDFKKELAVFQKKLGIIRAALNEGSPLSDIEKEQIKAIFKNGLSGMTFKDATELFDQLYEQGKATNLMENTRYQALLSVINFAYPLAWRYRMQQLNNEFGIRTEMPSAGVSLERPFGKVRSALDVIKESRLKDRNAKERPQIEENYRKRLLAILEDAYVAVERLNLILPSKRWTDERPYGNLRGEPAGYRTVEMRNETAELYDDLKKLDGKTGDRKKLNFTQLNKFTNDFTSIYIAACDRVFKVVEDRAFEEAVKALPWYKELLARTIRNADTIMAVATATGAIAGLFAGGVEAPATAAGARMATGRLISYLASKSPRLMAAMSGGTGWFALSGQLIAAAYLSDALITYAEIPKGLLKEERKEITNKIMYSFHRGIFYAASGLIRSYPIGLQRLLGISPMIYSRISLASNALVVGSAAWNVGTVLHDIITDRKPATPAEAVEMRIQRSFVFGDALFVALVLPPAIRTVFSTARTASAKTANYLRGIRGFREVSDVQRSIDLRAIYGNRLPAFSSGDIIIGGFIISDPLLRDALQSFSNRAVEMASSEEEREYERALREITPRRLTPELLELAGAKTGEVLGVNLMLLSLSQYLDKTRSSESKK